MAIFTAIGWAASIALFSGSSMKLNDARKVDK